MLGWYLPLAEPRVIPEGALIHRSVFDRMDRVHDYRPINLPAGHAVEEMPAELHNPKSIPNADERAER
jgi:hypothetical protein